ncbi:MAG: NTP transferase domain-containing protein [Candidatus Binatia bacterium]|nr:NTP transferase domain-containing protein [Candidatus Binatia bacterium]
MSLDVCILAGGLGTRLAGIWDGPKCLVPVAGKPVLLRLEEQIAQLSPRKVCLALGHLSREIIRWTATIESPPFHVWCYSIETEPLGTLGALRLAVDRAQLKAPLLVLNGDTLPGYDLARLVAFHHRMGDIGASAAWCEGKYAGAAVLNDAFLQHPTSYEERDLEQLLTTATHYYVPGFLDVGTPDDFYRAQHLKGYP